MINVPCPLYVEDTIVACIGGAASHTLLRFPASNVSVSHTVGPRGVCDDVPIEGGVCDDVPDRVDELDGVSVRAPVAEPDLVDEEVPLMELEAALVFVFVELTVPEEDWVSAWVLVEL